MVNELKEKLHNGNVKFTYTKVNGETRQANGTLQKSVLENLFGEDFDEKPRKGVVTYYDLDKNEWRCFKEENLVSIDE